MIFTDAKEAYALFLASDFWKSLSLACRIVAGFRCNRCGKSDHCQAHHVRYRQNWFDTQLADLECVCRECHEKEHGIVRPEVTPAPPEIYSMAQANRERSAGRITREQFQALRSRFKPAPKKRKWHKRKNKKGKRAFFTNSVRCFSKRKYGKFVNYGTSSN